MLKAHGCKAYKRFTDTGKNLTDLPMLGEQDASMAVEEAVVAAEPVVAAVLTWSVDRAERK